MPSTKLNEKTKADLVSIARLSGLLTTTIAQRMSKAELLNYMIEAETGDGTPKLPERFRSIRSRGRQMSFDQDLSFSAGAGEAEASPAGAAARERRSAADNAVRETSAAPAVAADAADRREASDGMTPDAADGAGSSAAQATKTNGNLPAPAPAPADAADVEISADAHPAIDYQDSPTESGKYQRRRQKTGQSSYKKRNDVSYRPSAHIALEKGEDEKISSPERAKKSRWLKSEPALHPAEQIAEESGVDSPRADSDISKREQGGNAESEAESQRLAKENQPTVTGVLEIMPDGYGFIRIENYIQSPKDLYLPPQYIRRFNLRNGDLITGPCRQQRDSDRYQALYYIKEVNGMAPDKMMRRPHFDRLTPIYPDERFVLETSRTELSTRIIDLVAPIGKGQRGMIVSPPKAGKTILLQKIANAISLNNPKAKLIVLLIDERPEEVTDMQRSIQGEVVYSTFDKTPENHVKITELVLERAERLVELGEDVVILLDSITRMGRAYNLTINPTGRTLSGGLDPGALYGPKRFFGAARNIEGGGSLTIIATALVETGSRMDEVIFEEFKGTGNMEVYLDRKLSEKRIFPAIDINRSGTRREELLLSKEELDAVWGIRKAFSQLDTAAVTETIISLLLKTKANSQFISSINVSFNDKSLFEAMRGTLPSPRSNGQNQD